MASSRTITKVPSTWVSRRKQRQNYNGSTRMRTNTDGRALVYWSNPFPRGATIISAVLEVHTCDSFNSGRNTTLHWITSRWAPGKVKWVNQPNVTGAVQTFSAARGKNQSVRFNITSLLQQVANGTRAWYGFEIRSDHENFAKGFWADKAPTARLRPRVIITWSVPPQKPTGLFPNSEGVVGTPKPTLSWVFRDVDGNSSQGGFSVQIANNPNFTGAWQASVTSRANTLNLNDTDYAGAPSGQTLWWRVTVYDDSGLWSGWSAPATFRYLEPSSLSLDLPQSGITHDPSPEVAWTFTAPTDHEQAAWRVVVEDEELNIVHDTGIVEGADNGYQIPPATLRKQGTPYRIRVEARDNVDGRVTVPGTSIWLREEVTVTYDRDGELPAITDLEVSGSSGSPYQDLTWTADEEIIDYFIVLRTNTLTGEVVQEKTVDPDDARVEETTSFRYRDWFVPARSEYSWQVQMVSAGESSLSNAVTKSVKNRHPWLMSADPESENRRIGLVNADIDPGLTEVTDVLQPLDGPPVLVAQQYGGFSGSVKAEIASEVVPGRSAESMLRDFLWLRKNPHVFFLWADQAIEAYIYNCVFTPISLPTGRTDYQVSFNFIQVGDLG